MLSGLQRAALKCIRELRVRRRESAALPLVCKICKDKTFTAAATLLYHYRSHAGEYRAHAGEYHSLAGE